MGHFHDPFLAQLLHVGQGTGLSGQIPGHHNPPAQRQPLRENDAIELTELLNSHESLVSLPSFCSLCWRSFTNALEGCRDGPYAAGFSFDLCNGFTSMAQEDSKCKFIHSGPIHPPNNPSSPNPSSLGARTVRDSFSPSGRNYLRPVMTFVQTTSRSVQPYPQACIKRL